MNNMKTVLIDSNWLISMLKSLHNVTLQEILQVHVAEVIAENGSTELINLIYTVTMNVVQVQ